jgi:hypothetical protein
MKMGAHRFKLSRSTMGLDAIPRVGEAGMTLGSGSVEMAKCPRGCGSFLVFTIDAIGRTRERCPKCQGVNRSYRRHPDEVPHSEVPHSEVPHSSAPLKLGASELHCQGCARPVPASERFCETCKAARSRARVVRGLPVSHRRLRCEGCGAPLAYKGNGRPPRWCGPNQRCLNPSGGPTP